MVNDNMVYQDNQSKMNMENNGRASSGCRTRHINTQYFFVTDRIQSNDMWAEYCPTDMVIADFYTKALQGKLFRLFRTPLLNLSDSESENTQAAAELDVKQRLTKENSDVSPSKECVEELGTKLATDRRMNKGTKPTGRGATYDTRQIVGIRKPMLMGRLKALAEDAE